MRSLPWVLVALLAAALGFFLGQRGPTSATIDPSDLPVKNASAVYQKTVGAVRTVRSSNADLSGFDARGIGTAFHIGGGYYVTAAHVVADGYQFFLDSSQRTVTRVASNDGLEKATVVGKDAVSDIAVLKAAPAGATLVWATKDPVVGEITYAIGNPFAIAPNSFSHGIVSGSNRAIGTERGTLAGLLQTDAPVNPGNSGGPLLDATGAVIGVVSANIAQTNQNAGVGFAVPVSQAKLIAETLQRGAEYKHPTLGVVAGGRTVIDGVQQGENAFNAGLQVGDEILKVGSLEVETFEELNAIIGAYSAGTQVELLVKRGGGTRKLTVKLEVR